MIAGKRSFAFIDAAFVKASGRAKLVLSLMSVLDPRIVRLRDRKRRSPRIIALLFLGSALIIGAVSFAATRESPPNESANSNVIQKRQQLQANAESASRPPQVEKSVRDDKLAKEKHPRFYDPLYVFSDEPITGVAAYPLAEPPGIVVDLKGAAEPSLPAAEFVGQDDRIKTVRRLATAQGLRYIVVVTTPIKRIEIVYEGSVAMVFPIL